MPVAVAQGAIPALAAAMLMVDADVLFVVTGCRSSRNIVAGLEAEEVGKVVSVVGLVVLVGVVRVVGVVGVAEVGVGTCCCCCCCRCYCCCRCRC